MLGLESSDRHRGGGDIKRLKMAFLPPRGAQRSWRLDAVLSQAELTNAWERHQCCGSKSGKRASGSEEGGLCGAVFTPELGRLGTGRDGEPAWQGFRIRNEEHIHVYTCKYLYNWNIFIKQFLILLYGMHSGFLFPLLLVFNTIH